MPHAVVFCYTLLRFIDTVKKSMTPCKVGPGHCWLGGQRPHNVCNELSRLAMGRAAYSWNSPHMKDGVWPLESLNHSLLIL